jgi:hypothetical protein
MAAARRDDAVPPIRRGPSRAVPRCGGETMSELQRHHDADVRVFFIGLLGIGGGLVVGFGLSVANALIR